MLVNNSTLNHLRPWTEEQFKPYAFVPYNRDFTLFTSVATIQYYSLKSRWEKRLDWRSIEGLCKKECIGLPWNKSYIQWNSPKIFDSNFCWTTFVTFLAPPHNVVLRYSFSILNFSFFILNFGETGMNNDIICHFKS